MENKNEFKSFKEFYPFYLSEHSKPMTKLLHFIGTGSALIFLLLAMLQKNLWFLPMGLAWGYLWAWISHFFIEKNRPATFKYPLYSFIGDWVMFAEILKGKHKLL